VLERWLVGGASGPAPAREAERIARVLDATGGNVARAARRLGLARSTLRGHIARLDLGAHLTRD
jgi:transcriptional regulator with GAF, ATPase, and Fis domain